MNNDSVVPLGRFGGGHIDGRRLRRHAQAVDEVILAARKRETHNVPKNECPNEGMNREVRDELR
jgi:hypothetical protein